MCRNLFTVAGRVNTVYAKYKIITLLNNNTKINIITRLALFIHVYR